MTNTEKAKLQKRAREAVASTLSDWIKVNIGLCIGGHNGIYTGETTSTEDAAIRRELRRAIRLVKSGAP